MTAPLDQARLRELQRRLRATRTTGVRSGKLWNHEGPEAADAIDALLDALSAERERGDRAGFGSANDLLISSGPDGLVCATQKAEFKKNESR